MLAHVISSALINNYLQFSENPVFSTVAFPVELVFLILVGAVTDAPQFEGKNIVITYINGDKCNDKQRFETKITFICDLGSMVGFSYNHFLCRFSCS